MEFFRKRALSIRSGWLIFGLLFGCLLPAIGYACECPSDGGWAPFGSGPDIYSTRIFGMPYPSDFEGHTYCCNGDLSTGCKPPVSTATGTSTSTCNCKSGYTQFSNGGQIFCSANGFNFPCGGEPAVSNLAAACQCKSGYAEFSQPPLPGKFCSANGKGFACGQEPDLPTSSVAALSTALSTSIETTQISSLGNNADGKQINSLAAANDVAALGAGQAATVGAIFCAQGANAHLANSGDANSYYANCIQSFDAAKGMSGAAGSYSADRSIIDGEAAQQSLRDFEKNFGVTKEDYLKRMLGEGGGPASLSEMVDGKIPEAKLTEALEAAGKLGPSDLTPDPNKFVVDLGGVKQKKAATALRDTLKKRLSENSDGRKTASIKEKRQAEDPPKVGDKEHLEPLRTDAIFAAKEEDSELSIFDVVHLRYSKLTARMHR